MIVIAGTLCISSVMKTGGQLLLELYACSHHGQHNSFICPLHSVLAIGRTVLHPGLLARMQ
jgi:hypothetical protein